MASILSSGMSTARDAAMSALTYLEVTDPPLMPQVVLAGFNLTQHPLGVFDLDRLAAKQRMTIGSVRGLLSPAEAKIYLSSDLAPRQEPWIIYHETGHAMIEWHRDALYLDTTHTLSPGVRIQMEREANEFAGDLLFLGPRFAGDARELPFGVASAIVLAERYGASIEASLRRYIESATEQCVCNVFHIATRPDGQRTLTFRYFTRPVRQYGRWTFGREMGQTLSSDDPLSIALNECVLDDGAVHYGTRVDEATGQVYHKEVLSTGHAIFVVVRMLPLRSH